ncbi:hypothetical protein FisN_2Lh551 [Fistulifera solaris]|uniref:Intimal thickness related receptor IRP domain-containing protein n=1 Tax=Fistulifera solaris TaxID=1519565 RepID=A0A1Z5JAV3_FISSO|nr:hypothetical protein FisN_2Lh551 [Fistulifera solaris]|eukprot:GAX11022.1 hypothetical protein FisN_2Lh551 [Fistulifera solaris]
MLSSPGVLATQQTINRELDPDDTERFLYSVSQAIQAPGTVDLSQLVFSNMNRNPYYYSQAIDDAYNENENNNEGDQSSETTVEVALLYCGSAATQSSGNNSICNLQKLGIGKYSEEDGTHYRCCTADAINAGVCAEEGRLVVDDTVFSGQWFEVVSKSNNDNTYAIDDPIRFVEQSGIYMVVLANCNQHGIPILTKGDLRFRSRYGYLPSSDWKVSWIAHAFTFMAASILSWLCRRNVRRSIDTVQISAVAMASVHSIMLSLYYLKYNMTGVRPDTLYHMYLIFNALTLGLVNAFMVLAAFGWRCLEKVYTSIPIHSIWLFGGTCTVILCLLPISGDHFLVGEFLRVGCASWALQVNMTTLHKLRHTDEEMFRRWAFMRALFVLSICLSCLVCFFYLFLANKSDAVQQCFLTLQQLMNLTMLVTLWYLIRPYNEALLLGKNGVDSNSQESDCYKRGIDP